MMMTQPLPPYVSQRVAADALALCRNTVRHQMKAQAFCGPRLPPSHHRAMSVQPRALSEAEREQVIDTLTSETDFNQPPVQVFHRLLGQGEYLCSVSTMHRLLRTHSLNGERRQQRPPQSHSVPRLWADAPNQVWTWDITKLPTLKRGEYLSLYVVMDLFSRHIVAWMLSRKENSALSSQLIDEALNATRLHPTA